MSQKKKAERTPDDGDQEFFGLPMSWDWRNVHKDIWNPEDDRIFPPKRFGIGWGLNVHALLKRVRGKKN